MSESPTQRTMRYLRGNGSICAVVEKWNQHVGPEREKQDRHGMIYRAPVGIRQDLFGIVDILVLDPARGFIGVQACSGSTFSAHLNKLIVDNAQACIDWLQTPGGKLEIWAWRKVKLKRGGKAERWQPRVQEITLKDLV